MPLKSKSVREGVMVVKDGKAWGVVHADGYSTSYGWVPFAHGEVRDPDCCLEPTDMTSRYDTTARREIAEGRLVRVRITETIEEVAP